MEAVRIGAGVGLTAVRALVHPRTALCAAIVLGTALRFFRLESHELQYDEAATGYFSALPWSDLWGSPAVLEPNPPLFYSLAWLVTHAGGSIEAIRCIPAIAGILCIPLAWLIARSLAGGFAAAGAALLVAASPQHIAISQYARAYGLLVLLLMSAFYCLLRIWRAPAPQKGRSRRFWWWAGYAASGAAALYTHHTAIVILAALNFAVLLAAVRNSDAGRQFLKEWLAANVIVAGLYAPWLPVIFAQMHPPTAAAPATAAVHVTPFHRWLWGTITHPFRFAGLLWIEAALVPIILFGGWRLRRSREAAFLLTFVFCGLVLMILASRIRPLLDAKTLAWASLFAVIGAAIGCSAAGWARMPLLAVALVVELRAIPAALHPPEEGWRKVSAILREQAKPQDAFYVNYAAAVLPLRHYGWSETGLNVKVLARMDEEPWFRGRAWPIIAPQAAVGDAAQAGRAWLLYYGDVYPARLTEEITAATKSVATLTCTTSRLRLYLFAAPVSAGSAAPAC